MSGECANQFTGPSRLIHRPGYAVLNALRISALKCTGAPSCWSLIRAFMSTGTICSRTGSTSLVEMPDTFRHPGALT
ncbi:hypothetical protein TNCV_2770921 [Trichonephila clavipes]|nr:hypothetical protein TNCV_2770921 [Trichonephila clavipes]